MNKAMKRVPLLVLFALIIAVPSVWANWVQDGVALCTATTNEWYPEITSDGAGGAIVAWGCGSNGGTSTQRVNASGDVQWTPNGVPLCTTTAFGNPAITSDGSGGAIVAWYDLRNMFGIIYAQRVNALGAVQWIANGVPLCTVGGGSNPQITSDGVGGAIVAWLDSRNGDWDIYAQRVNASGDTLWALNGVPLCAATGNQWYPEITSDGVGGAIFTWQDERDGVNSDIYAQWVNASGAAQWTADGVALCTATGDQLYPQITSDGAGGAIVTWYDRRSGDWDIYAQRMNVSGTIQWTTNGVALCTATGWQVQPKIVSDGVGGAIVTWADSRSGNGDGDIYAQRMNVSGTIQWTANGVPLCTATGDQSTPTIVSDGARGAIVTWEDYRSGSWDIYAQRVNASGDTLWALNGVPLCTVAWNQLYPKIISDGWGGAIVTWWEDHENVNGDIYAQRVDANGFLVLTGTDAPTVPVELHQNYPNPFNPTTRIAFELSVPGNASLRIYDTAGRLVRELINDERLAGRYEEAWDGRDASGRAIASGIYFYRLEAGSFTQTKKMVLLR